MIHVHSYHVLFYVWLHVVYMLLFTLLLFLRTCIIVYIVTHTYTYIYIYYYITYMREAFPARLGLCIMGQEKRESQWQIHQSQVESSATGASASCHSAGLGWSYDIHCYPIWGWYPLISYDFNWAPWWGWNPGGTVTWWSSWKMWKNRQWGVWRELAQQSFTASVNTVP